MKPYQKEFLEFAIQAEVLRFGEFTLKSGRISPYFFNTGLFRNGGDLARLGRYYAHSIVDSGLQFDVLYGPAYKGIPLVAATAIALAEEHGHDLPYTFNRKEVKDHGEGGVVVGAELRGDVLIVDDVISAGTSVRESVDIIEAAGATAVGVAISLDRQELGSGAVSAVQEVELDLGLRVNSIVDLEQLIGYLKAQANMQGVLKRVRAYGKRYGVKEVIAKP